jgi:hypothetical protein
MSDAHEAGSTHDVVEAATRYRERLIAEIEKMDAFLQTAGELCCCDMGHDMDFWSFESLEVPRTLH